MDPEGRWLSVNIHDRLKMLYRPKNWQPWQRSFQPEEKTKMQKAIANTSIFKNRRKYNAIRTQIDGYTFDSRKEARRYTELKQLIKGNVLEDLRIHPAFRIEVKGKMVCKYVADFSYMQNGNFIVEDVKGVRTAVYQLKKKLMAAVWGIRIKET